MRIFKTEVMMVNLDCQLGWFEDAWEINKAHLWG